MYITANYQFKLRINVYAQFNFQKSVLTLKQIGRDSAVGKAARYRLDGPAIESR
jgi:hypothetical protein